MLLSLFIREKNRRARKAYDEVLRMLVDLSVNWVKADISIPVLKADRWAELHGTLETLRLQSRGPAPNSNADDFFRAGGALFITPPRLRSGAAYRLPNEWIAPFLSSSITYFEFSSNMKSDLSTTLAYISKIPNVATLILTDVDHSKFELIPSFQPPIVLQNLRILDLIEVSNPSSILCTLLAPALQTLHISDSFPARIRHNLPYNLQPLSAFFIAWSKSPFLPTQLRSLSLSHCLIPTDVPFLIRWLVRLPSLSSLELNDASIGQTRKSLSSPFSSDMGADMEQTNIFAALTHPNHYHPDANFGDRLTWLCPS
ncbi:hypothetical protein H0H92_003360 [Tricholoma furcatifolium]|nr:hypothetical protein H0H92_003360 [Tricholoma furcatifolium]